MNDDRFDLGPLMDGYQEREEREERVVQSVMAALAWRAAPRADFAGAIVALGAPAMAMAGVVALAALIALRSQAGAPARPPTVGTALGIPRAAERVILGTQPASAQELLAALGEGR